jgi:ATP-binding cassette subfamily C (CFTR/MRP) protein 1
MMPRASTTFHDALLNSTLNAPQSFFGETDIGETTNRFSQDLQLIDMELPLALFTTCVEFISCIAQFIMIAVSAKFLGAALPFVIVVFYFVQKFYLRTARQLRLLDIEAKAPLFSMFLEVLSGLVTIRAYGWEEEFDRRHLEVLGVSQRPSYLLFCVQRWLNLVLDLVVWAIAIIVVTIATKTKGTLDPGLVGIALVNIINFGISIKQLISNWTILEVSIGAVARVRTFVVETESEHRLKESRMPPPAWPEEGSLEFSDITATYNGKEKPVINGLNLSILPGQKIAICGKSGGYVFCSPF